MTTETVSTEVMATDMETAEVAATEMAAVGVAATEMVAATPATATGLVATATATAATETTATEMEDSAQVRRIGTKSALLAHVLCMIKISATTVTFLEDLKTSFKLATFSAKTSSSSWPETLTS